MSAEIHYSRVEMSGNKEPGKPQERPSVAIPESFYQALQRERPDGLNWDRIDAAVAVLKGEKEAVTPKPPEPEPTEWQSFFRDMYQTGDKSPYKVKRGPVDGTTFFRTFTHPKEFIQDPGKHIMQIDKEFRGGVEIGDMKTRGKRAAVMVGNMVPNIALDILTSIPPNLLEKAFEVNLKGKLKDANALPDEDLEKISLINKLTLQVGTVRAAGRIGEVMNDKNITAAGNTIMRTLTGDKGWFTGEASDKLNDLLTAGYRDRLEDFANGPTIESAFRIAYQVPVVGALVEQAWTRWTNFQSASEYHKGNLKAVYTGIGVFIGILRNVDGLGHHTPSWWLTNRTWDVGDKIVRWFRGGNVKPIAAE